MLVIYMILTAAAGAASAYLGAAVAYLGNNENKAQFSPAGLRDVSELVNG